MTLRSSVAAYGSVVTVAPFTWGSTAYNRLNSYISLITYGTIVWGRKPKVSMNVDKQVMAWTDAIVALSTAHDKASYDAADYQMDQLIGPILVAPIAQVRELAVKLTQALHNHPQVPWLIWNIAEIWFKAVIEKAPDDATTLKLRSELARSIAGAVVPGITPEDLLLAVSNALRWRDPETLVQVQEAVQSGEKPRLVGRQSCLYLQVGGVSVML